jgi:hypothetical protein
MLSQGRASLSSPSCVTVGRMSARPTSTARQRRAAPGAHNDLHRRGLKEALESLPNLGKGKTIGNQGLGVDAARADELEGLGEVRGPLAEDALEPQLVE